MSSKYTTNFTTDPRYRAREMVRDRLERLAQEAVTTAECMEGFGTTPETEMWREVVKVVAEQVGGLNAVDDAERAKKNQTVLRDVAAGTEVSL